MTDHTRRRRGTRLGCAGAGRPAAAMQMLSAAHHQHMTMIGGDSREAIIGR